MALLDLSFNFGNDIYTNGISTPVYHQYLTSFISAVLAGFVAYFAAKWQINNLKKEEKRKEDERLKEERLQWFYSLYHLHEGLNSQIKSFDDTSNDIDKDLAKEPKIARYYNLPIVPDIVPNILHNINPSDIFKIFVLDKKDAKVKRQKLYTRYYAGLTYLNEIYQLIKNEQQKASTEVEKQQSIMNKEANDLHKAIQEIFSLAFQNNLVLPENNEFSDSFLQEIKGIYQPFMESANKTVEDVAINFGQKIIALCANSRFAANHNTIKIRPIAQSVVNQYNKLLENKKVLGESYKKLSMDLVNFNSKTLIEIMQIEFPLEFKNYKNERDKEKELRSQKPKKIVQKKVNNNLTQKFEFRKGKSPDIFIYLFFKKWL